MKSEKQLVLFFRQGTEIDNVDLAAKLHSKFELLGEPIVLPFNQNNPVQPLIAFQNNEIKLTVNISDVSIIYPEEIHKNVYDNVIEIVEYFEELDCSFERMGYISSFLHDKKSQDKFKKIYFKDDCHIDSEFQLSWYKKELIDSVLVNVWVKGITDLMNHVELITIYDINTPADEKYNITSEFLNDFLKQCDKYVEEKEKSLK